MPLKSICQNRVLIPVWEQLATDQTDQWQVDCLLIPVAFVVLCHVGHLWVTCVPVGMPDKTNYAYLTAFSFHFQKMVFLEYICNKILAIAREKLQVSRAKLPRLTMMRLLIILRLFFISPYNIHQSLLI